MLRIFISFALVLSLGMAVNCWGQARIDVTERSLRSSITEILNNAKVSGSLAYWANCGEYEAPITVGEVHSNRGSSERGSPVRALREVFADDPKMQVTQESGGMIRMSETGVPRDLLDVMISHISFKDREGRNGVWNPQQARRLILEAPELGGFMRVSNMEASESESINDIYGGAHSYQPHVSGDLYNVTLAEAMDYVLKSFPGFWVYGNCRREDGKRVVSFEIFGSMVRTDTKSAK